MTRRWCFTPESKQSGVEWRDKGSPAPQNFKTQLSAGKIVTNVFWDLEGVIHVDFIPRDITINAQYYINLLPNNMH
jgi:hypothetical protein